MISTINRKIEPKVKEIENLKLGKTEVLHLDNGIEVIVLNGGSQDVFKLDIVLRSGKSFQSKPLAAYYTNAVAREGGSLNYTANEIAETLDFLGCHLSNFNRINHAYYELVGLNKHFEPALAILSDILQNAQFNKEEFEIVLNKGKNEHILALSKDRVVCKEVFSNVLFGDDHPLGHINQLHHYDELKVEDCIEHYKKYYSSKNCTVFLSGKINKKIIENLNQYLGKGNWGNQEEVKRSAFQISSHKEKIHLIEKEDAVQSALRLGNLTINSGHPDYHKFRIMMVLFGGYFGSRLMSNIREDKGYTYSIYSQTIRMPHNESYFLITSEVGKKHRDATIKEISNEIERLQKERTHESELEIVKNYMAGSVLNQLDGPFKEIEQHKALHKLGEDESYFYQFTDAIRNITAEDIIRLSNEHLAFDSMYQVAIG